MDVSPNPQHPAAVKALLDRLRSSPAWQQAVAAPPDAPSVASLLAQLADTRAGEPPFPPPHLSEPRLNEPPGGSSGVAPARTPIDGDGLQLHAFSFQQSLSHLAQLSTEPGFVGSIRRVRHHPGTRSARTLLNLEIRFRTSKAPSNPSSGPSGSPSTRNTRKRPKSL